MIINCNPEFGVELTLAIPYAYWLHKRGELEKVITSKGMKHFYFFCDNVEEKYNFRTIDNHAAGVEVLPNPWIFGFKNNAKLYKNEWKHWKSFSMVERGCGILDYSKWEVPDYKKQFSNDNFNNLKPFVVICNRYNWEHGTHPVGYFNIRCLYEIFNYLTESGYSVVYKRPLNTEFPPDQNEINTIQNQEKLVADVEGVGLISDYDLTKYYDDVYLFDDIKDEYSNLTYNEVQLNLFANAEGFISMSGGSTLLVNLFKLPTITYCYNSSDLRKCFWEDENKNKNIKNFYYMVNPNIVPFFDEECVDMKKDRHDKFLKVIMETFK